MNPYEVLGVPENASEEEIKKRTKNSSRNTIRINIRITRLPTLQRKNCRRSMRHTTC